MIGFIAKFLTKRALDKQNRNPTVVHGNLLRSVAIIANQSHPQFQVIRSYVKDLRQRGIQTVDFYILFPNEKVQELTATTLKDFPFNPKSFGFFGQFKTPEIQRVMDVEYDLLLDLSEPGIRECELIVANINAKWKAGKESPEKSPFLDFMIDLKSNDTKALVHHLDNYLMNFNTQNAA